MSKQVSDAELIERIESIREDVGVSPKVSFRLLSKLAPFLSFLDEINFLMVFLTLLIIAMVTHLAVADALGYHLPLAVEFSRGRFTFGPTWIQDDRFFFPANWSFIQAILLELRGDFRFFHVPAVVCFVASVVLGRRLLLDQGVTLGFGAAAAVIGSSHFHRVNMFLAADFMYATFIALSWFGTFAYFRFPRFRYLALTGLGVGLAAGTKTIGLYYGLLPFAFILFYFLFFPKGKKRWQLCAEILGAGLIAFILVAPWYLKNWISTGHLLGQAEHFASGSPFRSSILFHLFQTTHRADFLAFILKNMVSQLGWFGFALVIVGLGTVSRRFIKLRDNGLELLFIGSSIILFLFQPYGGVYEEIDGYLNIRYVAWPFLYLGFCGIASFGKRQFLLGFFLSGLFFYGAQSLLRLHSLHFLEFLVLLTLFSSGSYWFLRRALSRKFRPWGVWIPVIASFVFAMLTFFPSKTSEKIENMWDFFYRDISVSAYPPLVQALDGFSDIRRVAFINCRLKLPLYGKKNQRTVIYEVSTNYGSEGVVRDEHWIDRLNEYQVESVVMRRVQNLKGWNDPVDYDFVYRLLKRNGWKALWEDAASSIMISPSFKPSPSGPARAAR